MEVSYPLPDGEAGVDQQNPLARVLVPLMELPEKVQ